VIYIGLSRRALLDIQDIEDYSVERWGKDVAAEYIQSIEDALDLIRLNPKLLRPKPNIPKHLCFYRVLQHFLVCAVFKNSIFVLTIKHGAMDLPARIAELEPQLMEEAKLLYRTHEKQVGEESCQVTVSDDLKGREGPPDGRGKKTRRDRKGK